MTIDAYVAELRALLPSTGSRRFLAEVEAHLRDGAAARVFAGMDARVAEEEAVEAFGRPDVVAARMRRETAPAAIRRASGVAVVGLVLLLLPLYVVPENLLPPAPWDERPRYLGALLVAALVCWALAVALAALAALVAPRMAAVALTVAAGTAGTSGLAGLAASFAWHVEAPETPWSVVAVAVPLTFLSAAGAVVAAAWARERVRDLA
jgi:hypothetical protein